MKNKMKVLYTLEDCNNFENSIYLAGPTFRTVQPDSWRTEVLNILENLGFEGTVFIPEYREEQPKDWTYSRQVDWETKMMQNSKILLFWIPRDLERLPGFITNVEFGLYVDSGKIVIGAPDDSVKNEYIKYLCSRKGITWFEDLKSLCKYAIERLKSKKEIQSKIFFTSDTHFNHQRTLELSKRPFKSLNDMNYEMIKRWNEIVTENDIVYFLGDFGDLEFLSYLNFKKIYFLPGNYDKPEFVNMLRASKNIEIIDENDEIEINNKKYRLVHEPEKMNDSESFYLFGHIHKLQMVKKNALNVGVDCHDFSPINIETVEFYRNAIVNHYDQNVFK